MGNPRQLVRLAALTLAIIVASAGDDGQESFYGHLPFSWLSNLLSSSSTSPSLLSALKSQYPSRSIVHVPSASLSDGGLHSAYVSSLSSAVHSSLDRLLDAGVCLDNDGVCPSSSEDGQLPPLSHGPGGDFSLLKMVMRPDGSLWSGVAPSFPLRRASPDGASQPLASFSSSGRRLFSKGFSLVVNKVQRRLPAVLHAALDVDRVVQYGESISCNLYMTPSPPSPNSAPTAEGSQPPPEKVQGFEAHFDWMDVIVLQLSGRKTWRVFHEALSPNPSSPLKFKPTSSDLASLQSGGPHSVSLLTLEPGDVLFIPRGHVHEAWVEPTEEGAPSLHLTYGVELAPGSNVEGLALRAVREAFEFIEAGRRNEEGKRAEKSVRDMISKFSLVKEYSWFRESYRSIDWDSFRKEMSKLRTSETYHENDLPLISAVLDYASSASVFDSVVSAMRRDEEARKAERNARWESETRLRRRPVEKNEVEIAAR